MAGHPDRWTPGPLDTRWLGHRTAWTPDGWTGDGWTRERTPNSGHGPTPDGVTGVLAFPTSATTLPYLGPPSEDSARQAPPAAIGNQDCLAVNTATAVLAMAATRQLHGGTPRSRLRLGALLSSDDYGWRVERAAKLHPLWQELARRHLGWSQEGVGKLEARSATGRKESPNSAMATGRRGSAGTAGHALGLDGPHAAS
jgi:hypothetical protein